MSLITYEFKRADNASEINQFRAALPILQGYYQGKDELVSSLSGKLNTDASLPKPKKRFAMREKILKNFNVITKAEDGFRSQQEPHPLEMIRKNKRQDQNTLQIPNPLTSIRQTLLYRF